MTTKKTTTTKPKIARVPLNGMHARRLNIPDHLNDDPGFVYRWFNDVQDRVLRARKAGYEFVTSDTLKGQPVGDPDVHNDSSSVDSRISKRLRDYTVYLMRIPTEYYLEDRQNIDKMADAIDDAIFEGGSARVDKSYGLDVKYSDKPR